MKNKFIFCFGALLVLTILFVGCSTGGNDNTDYSTKQEETNVPPSTDKENNGNSNIPSNPGNKLPSGSDNNSSSENEDNSPFKYKRYTYKSTGANEQNVTLSALMAYPNGKVPKTLTISCHATITSDKEAPSNFDGSDYMVKMMLSHAEKSDNDDITKNSLVILPDYEGYGETKGSTHPYLEHELTAKQVIDAVREGIKVYNNETGEKFSPTDGTVSVGYSQGGSVAMAVHKYIEQNNFSDEFNFKGSVCGDGPYDIASTIGVYIENREVTMPVVLPLILVGMCESNENLSGYQPSDFLTEEFLSSGILDWIKGKEFNTIEINTKLAKYDKDNKNCLTENSKFVVEKLFDAEVLKYFKDEKDNLSEEVKQKCEALENALKDNSLFSDGWKTSHPVYCFHCTIDDVVPFKNYESAKAAIPSEYFRGIEYKVESFSLPPLISSFINNSSIGQAGLTSIHLKAAIAFFYSFSGDAPESKCIKAILAGAWEQDK